MSNKAQTRVELLHLAYSLLNTKDRHGAGISADEVVKEAEALEKFVNKKPGTVHQGDLLVEGEVRAGGNVTAYDHRCA